MLKVINVVTASCVSSLSSCQVTVRPFKWPGRYYWWNNYSRLVAELISRRHQHYSSRNSNLNHRPSASHSLYHIASLTIVDVSMNNWFMCRKGFWYGWAMRLVELTSFCSVFTERYFSLGWLHFKIGLLAERVFLALDIGRCLCQVSDRTLKSWHPQLLMVSIPLLVKFDQRLQLSLYSSLATQLNVFDQRLMRAEIRHIVQCV